MKRIWLGLIAALGQRANQAETDPVALKFGAAFPQCDVEDCIASPTEAPSC